MAFGFVPKPPSLSGGAETDSAALAALASHEADTTNVHGVADTTALATDSDISSLPNKVDKSTLTAKGDILTATASSTPTNLPIDEDNYVLLADSLQASGVKWAQLPEVTDYSDAIAELWAAINTLSNAVYVIELVGYTTAVEGAGNDATNSYEIPTIHANAADGDLLVCIASTDAANCTIRHGTAATLDDAGYTVQASAVETSGCGTINIATKIYDSATDLDPYVTFMGVTTTGDTCAQIYVLRNVDEDQIDIIGAEGNDTVSTNTTVTTPGINTLYKGSFIVAARTWRFNKTAANMADIVDVDDDGLGWNNTVNVNGANGATGGSAYDYALVAETDLAEVPDKLTTFSGQHGGAASIMVAFAKKPKQALANTIKQEDRATAADPIPLWKQITAADTAQDSTNVQVTRASASPSPFKAVGQTATSTYYRKLSTTAYTLAGSTDVTSATITMNETIDTGLPSSGWLYIGDLGGGQGGQVQYGGISGTQFTGCSAYGGFTGTYPGGTHVALQDSWDGGTAHNHSYRTMLVANSATNTFYAYSKGEKLTTIMDFKLDTPNFSFVEETLIMQFRQTNTSDSPLMSLQWYDPNSVRFKHHDDVGGFAATTLATMTPTLGQWVRLACRIYFHPTAGTIELFYKTSEPGSYTKIYGPATHRTIYDTDDPAPVGNRITLSIGPYGECVQPPVDTYWANVQVVQNWDGIS